MWKSRANWPVGFLLALVACSSQEGFDNPPSNTGGTSGVEDGPAKGGAVQGVGGGVSPSGGAASLGGSTAAEVTGGSSSGGTATGGSSQSGGTNSGGTSTGGSAQSGGTDSGGTGTGGNGTGGTAVGGTGTGGTGAAATGGASSASGGSAASVGGGTSSGGSLGSTGGSSACVETAEEVKATPPIIEFLIDNTQSMSDTAPSTNNQTKMECTRTALAAAFPQLPTNYAVGMTYYHVRTGQCNDATQAVEIAPMTTNLQPLVNSIQTQAQIQGTPSHDAWLFAYNHLIGFDAASISSTTVDYAPAARYVVVMTDGVPTLGVDCANSEGCGQGISVAQYQEYIDAVAAAYQQRGVQTFFIGVPGSENTNQVLCSGDVPEYDPRTKLSELALAGGTAKTGCSSTGPTYCHIDLTNPSIDFVTELQNAIKSIAKAVASCVYPVPAPSDPTLLLDPDQVEIRYYPNGGATYQQILRSDGCTDANGWQYANTALDTITLCPGACSTLQSDASARVEVYFGCLTMQ